MFLKQNTIEGDYGKKQLGTIQKLLKLNKGIKIPGYPELMIFLQGFQLWGFHLKDKNYKNKQAKLKGKLAAKNILDNSVPQLKS